MNRFFTRTAVAGSTLAALAAAHMALSARPALGDDLLHTYGISNLGETCSGTCGPDNICCKIVVTQPAPNP
jgi:hypothetical protein